MAKPKIIGHPANIGLKKIIDGENKSSGRRSASSGKKKTVEKVKAPRIELTRMTVLELDGLEFLRNYTHEKTSAGAIKKMLVTIENLIKLRDELQSTLARREREMSNLVSAMDNVEAAQSELAISRKKINAKPSTILYASTMYNEYHDDTDYVEDED